MLLILTRGRVPSTTEQIMHLAESPKQDHRSEVPESAFPLQRSDAFIFLSFFMLYQINLLLKALIPFMKSNLQTKSNY